jgi:hypothetical protein
MWEASTRRELLQAVGGATLLLGCGEDEGFDLGVPDDASFDVVLDKLHTTDPVLPGGLANHGPMAAEALVTLGREDRVVAFIRRYDEKLSHFGLGEALPGDQREASLGQVALRGEWIAAFEAEALDGAAPRDLFNDAWSLLCPGYASIHGVLRVAHAVRSLERQDSESRRRELSFALGYWAADYAPLPGEPGSQPETGLHLVQALQRVPMLPAELRDGDGSILQSLARIGEFPDFASAVAALDLDALATDEALTELCAAAARLFVVHASGFNLRTIAYLHALTGSSALRLLWP